LDPEAVETFGVVSDLGEQVIQSFELPAALEVFAAEAFAEFFEECLEFFVARLVSHFGKPSNVPAFVFLATPLPTVPETMQLRARTSPKRWRGRLVRFFVGFRS
jgi:hypothetical protein